MFQDTNRLADAEPLMKRVVDIFKVAYGKEHPSVAGALSNLAALLQAMNRPAEAERLMRRALAIDKKSYGAEHPNVARDLNNLAALLQATNRLADAEPLYRHALAINKQSYGAEHPRVASALNNLAQLFQDTNRLAEAEPLMRRALAIDKQSYGAEHPLVAIRLNNLAQLLQDTNRLAEAEPLMRRALAIDEQFFGAEHPNVARDLNNLAQLLQATNRPAEAERLMRRALAIDKKSNGAEHPDVARDLNNLAGLLQATNRLAEAEPLMRRALAIDEQSYGAEHPDVARDLNNLAGLFRATNRLAKAEPLTRRVVEIFLKFTAATGHPHPHLQAALGNYASLLQAMGRSDAEVRQELTDLLAQHGLTALEQQIKPILDQIRQAATATQPGNHSEEKDSRRAEAREDETPVKPPDTRDGGGGDRGDNFRFSVFYPQRITPEQVGVMIAYAHLQSFAADIVQDASQKLKLPAGIPMRVGSKLPSASLPKESVIKVTPDVPGLIFDVLESTMALWQDVQSVEFRFKPKTIAIGQACHGWFHFWFEGVALANVPVTVFVADDEVPEIFREAISHANAHPYRAVFPSYSHDDDKIVECLEAYAAAFGDEYLRDVRRLRAGQLWNEELMHFIKVADVFQLFWSQNAAKSQYVQQEWQRALHERSARPDPYFLRPVYWTSEPASPIPGELSEIHFARVPL